VLGGRDAETEQRNLGDRYRELLLSRRSLSEVVTDPDLGGTPNMKPDQVEEAVEDLRGAITFKSSGANTFRINYSDPDRKRAQKVAAKLTSVLIHAETRLRQESAQDTVDFARTQKREADEELQKRDRAYSEFLSKHPEFAREDTPGASEGAAIRASQKVAKATPTGSPRLLALQRQIDRLRAVLAAPDGAAPPPATPHQRTPEQLAALQVVDDAKRQLAAAQRALEDASARFTDRHPDVIKAQQAVAAAQGRVRDAQAAVPPDTDDPAPILSTGPIDRAKLQRDVADLERQLATERAASPTAAPDTAAADDAKADAIVTLETQHKDLKRAVDEQREATQSLADGVFRAVNNANQQMNENSAQLEVVDEANEPLRPTGKGKSFVVIAGVILFGLLGGALALGFAILDDRLYRRADVEHLDLVPVLAVIPRAKKLRKK
jgi:hypothetical protein